MGRLLIIPTLLGGLLSAALIAPANAAAPAGTRADVSVAPLVNANGDQHGAVQPQDIDWSKVVKVLGSWAECEFWVPWAEAKYFPAYATCLPYTPL